MVLDAKVVIADVIGGSEVGGDLESQLINGGREWWRDRVVAVQTDLKLEEARQHFRRGWWLWLLRTCVADGGVCLSRLRGCTACGVYVVDAEEALVLALRVLVHDLDAVRHGLDESPLLFRVQVVDVVAEAHSGFRRQVVGRLGGLLIAHFLALCEHAHQLRCGEVGGATTRVLHQSAKGARLAIRLLDRVRLAVGGDVEERQFGDPLVGRWDDFSLTGGPVLVRLAVLVLVPAPVHAGAEDVFAMPVEASNEGAGVGGVEWARKDGWQLVVAL